MEIVEFLADVGLFSNLQKRDIQRLAVNIRQVSFPDGGMIQDNDSIDGLYIVKKGMAKVSKSSSTTAGVEAVLAILREGDSFGELGLIDGLPRSADVIAMGPVECYFLPRAAFQIALRENPGIAKSMLPTLAEMVRTANQWVGQLILPR